MPETQIVLDPVFAVGFATPPPHTRMTEFSLEVRHSERLVTGASAVEVSLARVKANVLLLQGHGVRDGRVRLQVGCREIRWVMHGFHAH